MDDSPDETALGDAGRPKVFICYAKDDAEDVARLFEELKAAGADPWFDMHDLAPGDIWESEIRKAIRQADVFVPCLSPNFDKPGYRQVELRLAIKVAQRQPPGQGGFIIPFILAPCTLPDWCEDIHAGDLSRPTTIKELLDAIEKHCGRFASLGPSRRLWQRLRRKLHRRTIVSTFLLAFIVILICVLYLHTIRVCSNITGLC